jgi:teichuronic acid biosynthesis glycosyltransferase TuaC
MPGKRLSILSFTTVFPRPTAPTFGIFVQSRVLKIALHADLEVVAPVAWIEYGNPLHRIPREIPRRRLQDGVVIWHPRWIYLPRTPVLTFFFLALASLMRVRREHFDVIDSHFGYPDGAAAALLALVTRRPFAITLRGNETAQAKAFGVAAVMGWALRRAARVITVSRRLAEFAVRLGVDPARVATIPNGINPDVFYPRDKEELRAKFGMAAGTQHILSVGYLIKRKRHGDIIQATAELRAAGRKVEVWIVGNPGSEDSCAEELYRLAARLNLQDAVHFVPGASQQTVAEYMTAADVLCLASTREGWPNVVHEALACGCPAVASDVGAVPDMLPTRDYGIVVPLDPAAEFAEALREALGAALDRKWDREAIAAYGRSRTWDAVAREALDQLSLAAGEQRR